MAGTLIDLVNSVVGNAVLTAKLPNGRALVIFIGDNDTNPRHVAAYMPLGTETSEGAMRPGGDIYGSGNDMKVGGIHSYPIDDVDVDTDKQVIIFEKGSNQDSGILGTFKVRQLTAADVSGIVTLPITEADVTGLVADLAAKLDDSQLDTDGTLAANSDTLIATQKAVKTYVDAHATSGFTNGGAQIGISGNGSTPATGFKKRLVMPYDATILSWTIVADVSGSATFTVKKSTYAGYPTTTSIVASAKPTLSSAQKATSSTLTGWTTSLAKGDVIEFYLDTVTTLTDIVLHLQLQRTS